MARTPRKQKKQQQYNAPGVSPDSLEGWSSIVGNAETIVGLVQSEQGTRKAIVGLQKTQNDLAKKYSGFIKQSTKELQKQLGIVGKLNKELMKDTKKKGQEEEKNTKKTTRGAQEIMKVFGKDSVWGKMGKHVEGMKRGFSKAGGVVGKMGAGIKKMAGSWAGMFAGGLVVGIFGFLLSTLTKFSKRITEAGKKFGILVQMGRGPFINTMLDAVKQTTLIGGNMADVVSVVDTLNTHWGIGLSQAADMSAETVTLAKALAMTNEDAAKWNGMMKKIYGFSSKQRKDFATITKDMAVQRGVNPSKAFALMAGASAETMIATGGSAQNLAEAAIAAADAGVELNSMAEGSLKMLDIQSSLGKEMKLNAMLAEMGMSSISANNIRAAVAAGDEAKAMKLKAKLINDITKSDKFQNSLAYVRYGVEKNLSSLLEMQHMDMKKIGAEGRDFEKGMQSTAEAVKGIAKGNLWNKIDDAMGPIEKIKLAFQYMLETVGKAIWDRWSGDLESWTKSITEFVRGGGIENFAQKIGDMSVKIKDMINMIYDFLIKLQTNSVWSVFMGTAPMTESEIKHRAEKISDASEGSYRDLATKQLGVKGLSEKISPDTEGMTTAEKTKAEAQAEKFVAENKTTIEKVLKDVENKAAYDKEVAEKPFLRALKNAFKIQWAFGPSRINAMLNPAGLRTTDMERRILSSNHDLRPGQFARAISPNTAVNIQGGGQDPEVITRESSLNGNNEDVIERLDLLYTAVTGLNLESRVEGGDLVTLLHQARK